MNKKNPVVANACIALVPGYGACGRAEGHVVHLNAGISPVEHSYIAPKSTGVFEKKKLSKRNIRYIARRSGKDPEELEMMRQVAKRQGRVLTLKYAVVEEELEQMQGLKATHVIMDEAGNI